MAEPGPDLLLTLMVVLDDATGRILYAQFWPAESTKAVLTALFEVFGTYGIPQSLYTDRASWAFHTPKTKGPVDKRRLTEVGQVLARLGVEHIPSYSPQARGRSERMNSTLQGRLVNELGMRGIKTPEDANRYLREVFLPRHNEEFACPARDAELGFVGVTDDDLLEASCLEQARTVQRDNTVILGRKVLQIPKQPGRTTCVGLNVTVRRYLDGQYAVFSGKRLMGCYDPQGHLIPKEVALGGALASAYRPRSRAA